MNVLEVIHIELIHHMSHHKNVFQVVQIIFKMVDVQAHVAVVMHNQQAEKHVLAHVLIMYQEVKDIVYQHPVIVLENIHITITLIVHHNVLHHVQIIIIHIKIVINV